MMKKIILALAQSIGLSVIGLMALALLLLATNFGWITTGLAQQELSEFYFYSLVPQTLIIWVLTTLLSLASQFLKNQNMRIPLLWSCAYMPLTYGLLLTIYIMY